MKRVGWDSLLWIKKSREEKLRMKGECAAMQIGAGPLGEERAHSVSLLWT